MNPFAENTDDELLAYINREGKKLTGRWTLRMALRELITRFEFAKGSDDIGTKMHEETNDKPYQLAIMPGIPER
jgi:hypothetical protein